MDAVGSERTGQREAETGGDVMKAMLCGLELGGFICALLFIAGKNYPAALANLGVAAYARYARGGK